MKAFIYERYGPPETLRMAEVDKPVPNADEALVKVRAASVNAADWHVLRGKPLFSRATLGLLRPKHQILFGSAPDSVRFRHIRRRPQVSATHLPGEEFAVTVHGRAVPIDVKSPEQAGFRQTLLDICVPRYGAGWESFLDSGPVYARIDADRMFTFHMSDGS
jgi:NADPH:quinone reductase-like Zn-dependent oxidoreductase